MIPVVLVHDRLTRTGKTMTAALGIDTVVTAKTFDRRDGRTIEVQTTRLAPNSAVTLREIVLTVPLRILLVQTAGTAS